MGDENLPKYDLEKVYDEKISPLMSQIIEVCKEHKIPMVASFQYQVTAEDGPGFCTTIMVDSPTTGESRYPAAEKLLRAAKLLKPEKPFVMSFAEWSDTDEKGNKTIRVKRLT